MRCCRQIDREQSDLWSKKNVDGYYLQHMLHFYFIWDPRIHHQSPEFEWKKRMRGDSFSMSVTKCIERSRREHEDLVAEFNSLMSGVEATLQATGMKIERLTQNEIFLEVKRALNPLVNDKRPFIPPKESLVYESARSQMASVNIEDELDEHVKIGGCCTRSSAEGSSRCHLPWSLEGTVGDGLSDHHQRRSCAARPSESGEAVQKPSPKNDGGTEGHSRRVPAQCGCTGGGASANQSIAGVDLKLAKILSTQPDRCCSGPHGRPAIVSKQNKRNALSPIAGSVYCMPSDA